MPDRRGLRLVVLVVGAGRARPRQLDSRGHDTVPEVGVLGTVADVLLAEAADARPDLAVEREGERPEEVGVAPPMRCPVRAPDGRGAGRRVVSGQGWP